MAGRDTNLTEEEREDQRRDEDREARGLLGNDDNQPGDDVERRRPAGEDGGEGDDVETRKAPLRPGKFHGKREDIARLARERRDAREDPELAGELALDRARMFGRNVEQPDLPTEKGEEGDDNQPPAKRKLKVNGQEIELSVDEIDAHAQKSLAAGDILERAKRDKDEAESLLQQLRDAKATRDTNAPAGDAPQPKPTEKKADTTLSEEALDGIIDRIQVGDPKDAKAALREYGDGLIEQVMTRIGNLDETIASTVHRVQEVDQRKRDTAEILEDFAKDNADIVKSRPFQAALATQTADTMRAKMAAINMREDTYERLQQERGLTENQAVSYAYDTLLAKGFDLPPIKDVFLESTEALRETFGIKRAAPARSERQPSNENFTKEREERKRVMNPQPRRANVASAMDQQERGREVVRADAVAQMRASRRGARRA